MAKFPRAAAAQDSAQVIFHEASESIKAVIQESERAKQRESAAHLAVRQLDSHPPGGGGVAADVTHDPRAHIMQVRACI